MGGGKGGNPNQETAHDHVLAQIAQEELDLSKEILRPVEDKMIRNVKDVDGRRDTLLGISNVESQAQFGQREGSVDELSGRRRSGLGSGADLMGRREFGEARGQSSGLGAADASSIATSDYKSNLDSLVGYGRGQGDRGVAGISDAASIAQNQVRADADLQLQRNQQNAQYAGTLLGYASNARLSDRESADVLGAPS